MPTMPIKLQPSKGKRHNEILLTTGLTGAMIVLGFFMNPNARPD
jgi:hypothetical protein